MDYVATALDNMEQVDAIYLDFAKDFDRVDHGLLLSKLKTFGFGGSLLKLLYSYLCDRSQVANIKGAQSNRILIPSGVPQDSISGPILLAIFINDLSLIVKYCKYLIFADDTKLLYRIV